MNKWFFLDLSKSFFIKQLLDKNISKSFVVLWASTAMILATWCGWGGGWKWVKDNKPPVFDSTTSSAVPILEDTNKSVNAICIDPESWVITYNVDSNNSKLWVSINNNWVISATAWNVDDWVNLPVWVNVTCSDWENNTTKEIIFTIQDEVNDKLSNCQINLPTTNSYNKDFNVSMTCDDQDAPAKWLLNSSYDLSLVDANQNVVYTTTVTDPDNTDNNQTYTWTFYISGQNIPEWNYTVSTTVTPVDWWENYEWDQVVDKNITLVNEAPVLNSVSLSWDTLVSLWNNNYIISKNVDHDITFTVNWIDIDGDNLQIVINWTKYNWTSKILTLNLQNWETKQFFIKVYDWKKYSNEILVQVTGA